MKERNCKLDVIRVVACLMVLLMHSPSATCGIDRLTTMGIYMLTKPSIGLFFMVSGALLLPVQLSYKDFIQRRLNKVVWPTLIFTILYIAIKLILGEASLLESIRLLLSIPFAPTGHGVLWFMYTMIGLYLLAPIITPFLQKSSKKELQFVLLLWIITLFWSYLQLFLDVRMDETSMLYTFSGYQGYFVLGYYLKRFPFRISLVKLLSCVIISVIMQLIVSLNGLEVNSWYLSPIGLLLTIVAYQLMMQYINTERISIKAKSIITDFSNCSFGIYLLHIFVLFRIVHNNSIITSLNPYFQVAITFFVTVAVTWFIVHLISLSQYGKYIIGYSKKK